MSSRSPIVRASSNFALAQAAIARARPKFLVRSDRRTSLRFRLLQPGLEAAATMTRKKYVPHRFRYRRGVSTEPKWHPQVAPLE